MEIGSLRPNLLDKFGPHRLTLGLLHDGWSPVLSVTWVLAGSQLTSGSLDTTWDSPLDMVACMNDQVKRISWMSCLPLLVWFCQDPTDFVTPVDTAPGGIPALNHMAGEWVPGLSSSKTCGCQQLRSPAHLHLSPVDELAAVLTGRRSQQIYFSTSTRFSVAYEYLIRPQSRVLPVDADTVRRALEHTDMPGASRSWH